MPQLLDRYYGLAERDCDMILLGNNFAEVFDPATDFDADGVNRFNGIRDSRMLELSIDLRKTEPGDVLSYCRKWLAFQEYRTAIAMEIPIYSNAYFDFHIRQLRNYEPSASSSWTDAVLKAYLSEEEPETEMEIEEEDELEFDF